MKPEIITFDMQFLKDRAMNVAKFLKTLDIKMINVDFKNARHEHYLECLKERPDNIKLCMKFKISNYIDETEVFVEQSWVLVHDENEQIKKIPHVMRKSDYLNFIGNRTIQEPNIYNFGVKEFDEYLISFNNEDVMVQGHMHTHPFCLPIPSWGDIILETHLDRMYRIVIIHTDLLGTVASVNGFKSFDIPNEKNFYRELEKMHINESFDRNIIYTFKIGDKSILDSEFIYDFKNPEIFKFAESFIYETLVYNSHHVIDDIYVWKHPDGRILRFYQGQVKEMK